MKRLILIPLLLFCISAFGQWTKPQLYENINTNIRLKTYSPTRISAVLDSIVVSMGSGSSFTLTDGNGTTANGTAVDLGGVINGSLYSGTEIYPDTNNEQNFSIGKNGNAFNQIQFYSGDNGYQMFNNGAATSFTDFGYDGLGGTFSPYNFNVYFNNRLRLKSLSGIIFDFDQTGIKLDLGSDATGDTYQRNSSGYLERIPIGTANYVFTSNGTTAGWAAPSGGGISGLTTGRVPFATSSTTIGDDSNLAWNNTTKALTIGSSTIQAPTDQLFIGQSSGNVSNTQPYDIAIGFEAMQTANTGGTGVGRNIAIGHQALQTSNTDRQHQIAIGFRALGSNTGASENIGIGYRAGERWLGEDNIAIGFGAGYSLTGSGRDNVFIGYYAGGSNVSRPYTNGAYSVFIGSDAGTDDPTARGQVNIANSFIVKGNAPGTSTTSYPDVGNAGIFVTTPTARLHLPAAQAAAGKASLKIPSGVIATTPAAGNIEADATDIYWTNAAGTRISMVASGGMTDPMTTRGDIIYRNASNVTARLGIGANTYVLSSDGTDLIWAPGGGGGGSVWGGITGTIASQTDLIALTDTKWALSGTSTLTGVTTITSNVANQHLFGGTWTATANNQYHMQLGGTFTSRTTAADNLYGYVFNPALVLAGSSAQAAVGVRIAPTFSGGTSPVYTTLLVTGHSSSSTHRALRVENSAGTNLFQITSDGQISTGSTILSLGGSTVNYTTWGTGSNSSAQVLNLPTGIAAGNFTIQRNGGGTYSVANTGVVTLTTGLTSNTAAQDFVQFQNRPTFNLTGSYTGTVTGYKYDPVLTATTAGTVNLAFWATSGKVLIGGSSITANTSFDLRASGSGSDRLIRLANSSNTEIANFRESGEFYSVQSGSSYKEKHVTGTASGTSFSETIYTSSEFANDESVTLEVQWTVMDLSSNTGAGGVFYTTWTKSGGAIVKAGDNQLVTNNNTGDTFTVSTADSSGNISLTISSTGSSGNWKGNAFVKSITKL